MISATWKARIKRGVRIALGLSLAPWIALVFTAPFMTVPADETLSEPSLRVFDREHHLLREVRNDEGARRTEVPLSELGERVQNAVIAAEDARFRSHRGVDPLAVVRAGAGALRARRQVSGASTMSMQVARTLVPHRKNLLGKFFEAALALKLEWRWGKNRILETYLNRVAFGAQILGVEAAAEHYFNKRAKALSHAEAATIASLAKSPIRYPKDLERLRMRRNYVLGRMLELKMISAEECAVSQNEPLQLGHYTAPAGALHLTQALAKLGVDVAGRATLETTIDGSIQSLAENAVTSAVVALQGRHVTSASAIVLDNQRGEVLAYVGAPDARAGALSYVDGVLAERQAGSTLKPFVYGLALERLEMGPWTLLPDRELRIETANGVYVPQNYDNRYHGPVRLREALANSYNVPAVYLADKLGPGVVLEALRGVGFVTLRRSAEDYGVALALGDGEVRLIDLARAYSTLARGGRDLPITVVRSEAPPVATPVMPSWIAETLTHMLADNGARLSAFGRGSALEFAFPVAVKTGTSKDYRDNWTVGFTHTHTVAVWAGNVDGSPMEGVSGVTGAGRIFHDIVEGLGTPHEALSREAPTVRVCADSGESAARKCTHVLDEVRFGGAPPVRRCALHEGGEIAQGPLTLMAPRDGARFILDPRRPSRDQSVEVRASVSEPGTLYVDGRATVSSQTGTFEWVPSLGEHWLYVKTAHGQSSPGHRVTVQAP